MNRIAHIKQFIMRYPYSTALVLFAFVAYALLSVRIGFLGDDWRYLYEMERYASPWGYLFHPYTTAFSWRPIADFSWVLSYIVFHTHAAWYHITNILIFFATVACVFTILRSLVGERIAVTTSVLFTFFPVHYEILLWISGRTDSLALLFSAFMIWLFMRGVQAPQHRLRWWGISIAAFIAALLSKEWSIMTPAIILLIDTVYLYSAGSCTQYVRTRWKIFTCYGMVAAIFLVLRAVIVGDVVSNNAAAGAHVYVVPTFHDIALAADVFTRVMSLSTLKYYAPVWTQFWSAWHTELFIVLVVLLGILQFRSWKNTLFRAHTILALAIVAFYTWPIFFLLGNVTDDLKHARLLYAPSLGVAIFLAVWIHGTHHTTVSQQSRWYRYALFNVIVIFFLAASVVNAIPWLKAAQLSRTVVQSFGEQYPKLVQTEKTVNVYAHAVPGEIDGAYVFHDYYSFGEAIRTQYHNPYLHVQAIGTKALEDSPFCDSNRLEQEQVNVIQWKNNQFIRLRDVPNQWKQRGDSAIVFSSFEKEDMEAQGWQWRDMQIHSTPQGMQLTATGEHPTLIFPLSTPTPTNEWHTVEFDFNVTDIDTAFPLQFGWLIANEQQPTKFNTIEIPDAYTQHSFSLCEYPNWVITPYVHTMVFTFPSVAEIGEYTVHLRSIRVLP